MSLSMTHYAAVLRMGVLLSCSLRYNRRHQQQKGNHREVVELSTPSFIDSMQHMKSKRTSQKQTLDVSYELIHDTLCSCSVHGCFVVLFSEVLEAKLWVKLWVHLGNLLSFDLHKSNCTTADTPTWTKPKKKETKLRQQLLANATSGNQITSTTEQSQR